MSSSIVRLSLVGIAACLLAGCAAPPAPTEPTIARVTAEGPEGYDRLWDSATEALRRSYFRIDRRDRIEGVITTLPETSAQFFEFWRPQSDTAYHWAESNLHTIALAAKVNVKPAEDPDTYDLAVQVERLRYSLEERQVDNPAAAMRLFSGETPTVSGRMERPSETFQWIPVGRDQPMEEKLLALILKRYGESATAGEPCDEEIILGPEETAARPE